FERYQKNIERSSRTIDDYRLDLNLLNRYLQTKYNAPIYVEDVTRDDVSEYLFYLKEERNYKPSSRKRMLASYRTFFKYAYLNDWCESNVTETLEPIKDRVKERQFLSEAEVNVFINAIDHRLIQLVARMLYFTGMRISESLNLSDQDINMGSNLIHIRQGKGNKDRTIPMHPKLKEYLKDYIQNWKVHSDYFFATKKSGRLSKNRVVTVFRETSFELGLKPNVTAHVLRHSFASNLVKNDVHLVKISK